MYARDMLSRRNVLGLGALSLLTSACEAIGLKATVVTTKTVNGKTTTRVREAKNWDEFEAAMGEVATDFSDFAKQVGATTAELAKKLVDVPPQGQVQLGQLASSLKPYEGDVRYDYLKVARMNPDAAYDFKYVQIGMPEYDNFFRASAEMYATAYQLMETGRHVFLAQSKVKGQDAPSDVENGDRKIKKSEVASALSEIESTTGDQAAEGVEKLKTLWLSTAELGVQLAAKTAETVQTGVALVASAPTQILNPKLLLHLKLIVKGLDESVSMVKDTGKLLGEIVG
ncbi:MAG: hypothetical protein KC776_18435 [Myxococcales bacterium]|nr:hypothetical protein [Myxococcales bacterium]MCB9579279.1 hypothetical protein [Polyangiaceae bacterium]